MERYLVVTSDTDSRKVARTIRRLERNGIPSVLETRVVTTGEGTAEGYRVRIPADRLPEARAVISDLEASPDISTVRER
jgi:hypothetical protein